MSDFVHCDRCPTQAKKTDREEMEKVGWVFLEVNLKFFRYGVRRNGDDHYDLCPTCAKLFAAWMSGQQLLVQNERKEA